MHTTKYVFSPRAMLCDFGTSRDMMASLIRTGNTGTLEYAAPESISRSSGGVLRPAGSSCDMWSLGMVLHRLLFLRLPYPTANREASAQGKDALTGPERLQQLEREVLNYKGYGVLIILSSEQILTQKTASGVMLI
jgi:serine/threonine protein kinase